MIFKQLELTNFKSHQHNIINFNSGITLIIGENGAGKSTIFEAISFVLYKKYTGREIHVKLFKKMDDLKEFEGILESVNEEENKITVNVDGKNVEINIKDIATAYTTYDFDAVLKGNTDNVNLNKLNKFNKKR